MSSNTSNINGNNKVPPPIPTTPHPGRANVASGNIVVPVVVSAVTPTAQEIAINVNNVASGPLAVSGSLAGTTPVNSNPPSRPASPQPSLVIDNPPVKTTLVFDNEPQTNNNNNNLVDLQGFQGITLTPAATPVANGSGTNPAVPALVVPVNEHVVPAVINQEPVAPEAPLTPIQRLLKKDSVEQLWIEKFVDVKKTKTAKNGDEVKIYKITYIFKKIMGALSYLIGKRKALKKDETAIKLGEKAKSLAAQVGNRVPSRKGELHEDAPVATATVTEQAKINLLFKDEDKAIEEFYAMFKKRVEQISVGPRGNDYGVYAGVTMALLKEKAPKRTDLDVDARIESTQKTFNKKVLEDMKTAFASQELAAITLDGFNEKVTALNNIFAMNDVTLVETQLREAILKKHSESAIDEMIDAYSDASRGNAKFDEMLQQAVAPLETELDTLSAELRILSGPVEQEGSVAHARAAAERAEDAKTQASQVYDAAHSAAAAEGISMDPEAKTAFFSTLYAYVAQYRMSAETLRASKIAKELKERLATLAKASSDAEAALAIANQALNAKEARATEVTALLEDVTASLDRSELERTVAAKMVAMKEFYEDIKADAPRAFLNPRFAFPGSGTRLIYS